jgi:HAE1 family hydrophobic/amphiphilic exporter-1
VFVPVALIAEGASRFFMIRLVTPVCVSLLASLFVALVLVPLASVAVLEPRRAAEKRGVWGWINRIEAAAKRAGDVAYRWTFDALKRAYVALLRRSLQRRFDVFVVALAALGSLAIPWEHVENRHVQTLMTRNLRVQYSMPSETTLAEADAFFRDLEHRLAAIEVDYHATGHYVGFDANSAQVQVFFAAPEPGEPPFETLASQLLTEFPVPPGWEMRSRFAQSDGGRERTFNITLHGEDYQELHRVRSELERQVASIEGVVAVQGSGEDTRQRNELGLAVERGIVERLDIGSDAVARTVAAQLRGATVGRFRTTSGEVDIEVRMREEDRDQFDELLEAPVRSRSAADVPLGSVVRRELVPGEVAIERVNKRVGTVIRLELDDQQREATIARLGAFIAGYRLPEGMSFTADERDAEIRDAQRDLVYAMVLGTIFIFLLMGFLFESFVLPLSVVPSIPLSFVGVWWCLYWTGEHIDELAGIGIVLLLGVVVNNAIVLIDFVNRARGDGLERDAAIVAAGRARFRPILMTALTTIGGLIPLAFSDYVGEGISYGPFGKALVGGMVSATILTLVVVPVTYAWLDDLREGARRWWYKLSRPVGRSSVRSGEPRT